MRILEHRTSGILAVMGVPSDADLDAIAEAVRGLGVAKRVRRAPTSITVDFVGGSPVDVVVTGMNTVRPGVSSRLESGRPLVVVADRVPAAMRAELDIHAATGEIIRTLTIDPDRRYHGTGQPRGGPRRPYGPRKKNQPEP